jgi:hypothetical protein
MELLATPIMIVPDGVLVLMHVAIWKNLNQMV